MTVRVEASVVLRTDVRTAFAAVVDLPFQERWIVATTLYPLESDVPQPEVGSRLAAFTGFAGLGFLDVMEVTRYEPPHRWHTAHQAAFVQGVGIFEVQDLGDGTSRMIWAEELILPFGVLGRAGWPLVAPIARFSLQVSLNRLARLIDRGILPGSVTSRPLP
jgi:uncharacterized protein YndB with AHSA1/START domain